MLEVYPCDALETFLEANSGEIAFYKRVEITFDPPWNLQSTTEPNDSWKLQRNTISSANNGTLQFTTNSQPHLKAYT